MGGLHVLEGRELLTDAGIPVFRTPESALAAFSHMVKHRRNQELMLEAPGPYSDHSLPEVAKARAIIRRALASGRKELTTSQAKRVLEAFHVPVNPTIEVDSGPAAVRAAEDLGYPVALKISSLDLSHKNRCGRRRAQPAERV